MLDSAAPADGTVVSLTSALTSAATVPDSVTVLSGSTTATFPITTYPVASAQAVTITASLSEINQTTTLTVNPCSLGAIAPPGSFPATETVWVDDQIPTGTNPYGTWVWDTAQKASGTQSHTEPVTAGLHYHGFDTAWPDNLYVQTTDNVFTYVLVDPCNPPQEILLQFDTGYGWTVAFWGADLVNWGTTGFNQFSMGPLPAAGQWVRLEIPAATLGLGGHIIGNITYALYDGRAWFDRTGVLSTCLPSIATAPSFPATDTVWVDDQIPAGTTAYGGWIWDTTQKASGTQSHTQPVSSDLQYHGFNNAWADNLYVEVTDKLIAYVLIDPCDPPREILLQWIGDGGGVRAFWGADLINWGTTGVDQFSMGPLPSAGQWARLEVPASTLGLGGHIVGEITFAQWSGHVWWDYAGKGQTCAPTIASTPAAVASETIWIDDQLPADAGLSGTWNWDTTQKASGTQSHSDPPTTGVHYHGFNNTWADNFYVAATDKLIAYVLIDPCDPPQEILLQWNLGTYVRVAFWGADLINWGTTGVDQFSMGPMPTTGQWVRLEVPASLLGAAGRIVGEIDFAQYDGHAWWDRVGKLTTCTAGAIAPPASFPPDTVWFDDAPPAGATTFGIMNWDTTQKASGTQSHTEPAATGMHQHGIENSWTNPLTVSPTDNLVCYVLIDPCDPPQELMLQWNDGAGGWEHRAFWGADLINFGTPGTPAHVSRGPLPAAGQWVRLEVPASTVGVGATIGGMAFTLYDGHAWFDWAGKGTANGAPTLSLLALSPLSVVGGASSTGTVTLTGAAPTGGAVVALSSSNINIATVPGTVTIAAGATSQIFTVTSLPVAADTSATIAATYTDTQTATLTVTATSPALSGVSVSPANVAGGDPSTGTVTLTLLAPAGGVVVALSSSTTSAATVPASVTVPAGAASATFSITTLSVASTTIVTITATYAGVNQTANLTVTPPGAALSAVSLSPTSVLGGASSTGTVMLTAAAPTGGAAVSLSSDNTAAAAVPSAVTVAGGATSATFTVTTSSVASNTTATISAIYASVTKTANILVTAAPAAALASVSVSPTGVVGGSPSTGTVTLTVGAPAGGAVVSLSSSNTSVAAVPSSVALGAGSVTATFAVTTSVVASSTSATITATYSGATQTATLTVNPAAAALASVSLSPSSVVVGAASTGTVTLTSQAPAGGAVVSLSSSNTSVASVPSSVTVPAGSTSGNFTVTTSTVASSTSVTLTATYGATQTATLTVTPSAALSSLAVSPSRVVGGGAASGTITLSAGAPPGGVTVTLTSSNTSAATVPASVTLAQGEASATFAVSTPTVVATTSATITAAYGGASRTSFLLVVPYALVDISSVVIAPSSVEGGSQAIGTVTLTGPAPPGGAVVKLSSNSAVGVPAKLIIPAGSSTGTFPVTTNVTTVSSTTVVSASFAGAGVSTNLTVTPTSVVLASLSLSPSSVVCCATSTGTVTLSGPAPSGGVLVHLDTNNSSATTVPRSVIVPAGDSSATFTIATSGVPTTTNVTVSAGYATGKTATLTITPPTSVALFDITVSPTDLLGVVLGYDAAKATGKVILTGPAPPGGAYVEIDVSGAAPVDLTWAGTIPAGQVSGSFTLLVSGDVAIVTPATLTASYGGVQKTASVNLQPFGPPSVTMSPPSVVGGTTVGAQVGTLTLPGAPPGAGTSGVTVSLSSSDSTVAAVPTAVALAYATDSFGVQTYGVAADTEVTLSASCCGGTNTAILTVTPASLLSLSLDSDAIVGGATSTATITLDGQAPFGGAVVTLQSPDAGVATLSSTVTIPAGAFSATVPVTTLPVTTRTPITLTATYRGTTVPASLGILPNTSSTTDLAAVAVAPSLVVGGESTQGTVTLTVPAPPGGAVVSLSSDNPAVAAVPSSLSIPGGGTSATFPISTQRVDTDTQPGISATLGTTVRSTTLVVTAAISGTIPADTTLTTAGSPYVLSGSIIASSLTIEPGVTLKFTPGSALEVTQSLHAIGTSSYPIVLTSAAASPARGDWGGLRLLGGGQLSYVTVSYSGVVVSSGSAALDHVTVAHANGDGVAVSASGVIGGTTITNSVLTDNSAQGVYGHGLNAGAGTTVTVSDTTVSGSGGSAIVVEPTAQLLGLTGMTLTGNGGPAGDAIEYGLGAAYGSELEITQNATWSAGVDWVLTNPLIVDGSLTIQPGARVKLLSNSGPGWGSVFLRADQGKIVAVGTSGSHITFTSAQAAPARGDWGCLDIEPGRVPFASQIVYADIAYGGNSCNAALVVNGGLPTLDHVTVTSTGGVGAWIQTSSPPITNLSVSGSSGAGLLLLATGPMSISNSTFTANGGYGLVIASSTADVSWSVFGGNGSGSVNATYLLPGTIFRNCSFLSGGAGLVYDSQSQQSPLDAAVNYWNAASGPSGGGSGSGVSVSSGVAFEPYLTAPPASAQFVTSASVSNRIFNPSIASFGLTFGTSLPGNWSVKFSNASSAVVRTISGSGATGAVAWDGHNDAGVSQPDGSYTYEINSTTASSQAATPVRGLAIVTTTGLLGIALNPDTVAGGSTSTGTVSLASPAPVGGIVVALSSSNPSVATVPASVTVAAGAASATFTVTTVSVASGTSATISATYQGATRTASLAVIPTALSSLVLNPTTLAGGNTSIGTVSLNGPAPIGGALVTLSSSNPALASPPPSVTISYVGTSATFGVPTTPVSASTPVTITASYGSSTQTAALTVNPAGSVLQSVSVSPASVAGGNSATGTVTLSAAAPAGGATVALSSSNTSVATVPPNVPVSAGATTANFAVTTLSVASSSSVTITATYASVTRTATLSVTPAGTALSAISLSPAAVVGGLPSAGTATLTAPAPAGGVAVALASDNPATATVPASVTVAAGATSVAFTVTTVGVTTPSTVTISGTSGGVTKSAALTVNPGVVIRGLAPGAALPGDANEVLYGEGFDTSTTVTLAGPVYALTDPTFTSPLCDLSGGACAITSLAASFGTGGTLAFALPSSTSTGFFWVRGRSGSGTDSANGAWLKVEQSEKTYPVVPPAQHGTATRIYAGQTVTGTFAAGGDTSGAFADYNTYYFVGTAGSSINVSLTRVDTSMTWENPSSLDPQIDIIAPDEMIYSNLRKTDDQPGIDYNASLAGAVLPLTGIYYLRAETLKGSGDYSLTFSFSSVAPAPVSSRAIPLLGNANVVPVNGLVAPTALLLDPRGYPVSGAGVNFAVVPSVDDQGAASFVGSSLATSSADGLASVTARLTAVGRVELTPSFASPILGQWRIAREQEAQASDAVLVPRYPTAAVQAITPSGIGADGVLRLVEGRREEVPIWQSKREGMSAGGAGSKARVQSVVPGGEPAPATATSTALRPLSIDQVLSTETITSCGAATFAEAAVNAPVGNPPYTVTLSDEAPSTGQSQPNGDVDSGGIHGHRVGKTIRMKIDVKDAGGSTPGYPVLVHLALGGPAHGKLILDPDGNRVQCDAGTFLWHERDAKGNIVALNEEFEYQLGTYAPYVGVIPDPINTGQLDPVWGIGETLKLEAGTLDSSGAPQVQGKIYSVHPEPGKPDHFAVSVPPPPTGTAEPVWQYWSDWTIGSGVTVNGRTGNGVVRNESNKYYLMDRYDNVTFGYTGLVQPAAPATTMSLSVFDQTSGSSGDPNGYGWTVSWNDNPAMPQGSLTSAIQVNYPNDPEWSAGSVSKSINFQFDHGGQQHFLAAIDGWDWDSIYVPSGSRVFDPDIPWTVSPGASGDGLPKSMDQADPLLHPNPVDSARAAFIIGKASFTPAPPWRVFPTGATGDPAVEVVDNPSFRVSLVDANNQLATDAAFQVHLCPRYDHFAPPPDYQPRLCTTAPIQSSGGVIPQPIRVNANGSGAADSQGYMGVELLTAPSNPGTYYIKFEILDSSTYPYRIREEGDIFWDKTPAGQYQGAFAFVTVIGAEILNENFRPADLLIYVGSPKQYYVRYAGTPGQVLPTSATVDTKNEDGTVAGTIPSIALTRVGSSSYAISGPFTLDPPIGGMSIRRASVHQVATAELNAGSGTGKLEATVATQTARRDTQPAVVIELTVRDDKGVMVPRDVQRQTGYLICPNADDDLLVGMPDYVKPRFPARNSGSVYIREREDTVQVTVTKTAQPSQSSQLMLRGSINGDSFINLYDSETGALAQLPFQVPWDKITNRSLSYFAETAGTQSKPVELRLSLDSGPEVPPDKAMFHGCDGSYFFISGAGHDDADTHYITGFNHAFQHQKLCGFADLNVSRGGLFGVNDLNITKTLFAAGLVGVPPSDPAYQTVQDVLSATATARAAGKAVLVGYSFGASVTAAAAVEAARTGSRFSVCAIIGAPISDALLAAYRSACGLPLVKDIPGDAIRAGSASFWNTTWDFYIQWRDVHGGAPHFFYAQDINDIELQHRRDSLIQEWETGGALSGQCPASQ